LIQNGLNQLGHSPGAIDGLCGLRTARAMKALLAANGRAAAVAPLGALPWITLRPNLPCGVMKPVIALG